MGSDLAIKREKGVRNLFLPLAVAGLLTVSHAVPETCGRRFRRGQETRDEQAPFDFTACGGYAQGERSCDQPLVRKCMNLMWSDLDYNPGQYV
jgi:hypothetical protein